MDANKTIIAWLNDARALEMGLVQALESQAHLARDFPEMQEHFQLHADESRNHAQLVEGCIERLGGRISATKGLVATVTGGLQGVATALMGDDLMKGLLASFASEHLEVASYRALIIAAGGMGEQEPSRTCHEILPAELAMIDWLNEQLPTVTRHYLASGRPENEQGNEQEGPPAGAPQQLAG
jgi:ferritin-like metal-binding protein YciE